MKSAPFMMVTLLGLGAWSAFLSAGEEGEKRPSPVDPAKVFAEFDKDNDGKISASEIPDEKRKFFDRLLRIGDLNGDGILEKQEFEKASKEPDPSAAPKGGDFAPGANRQANPEELFKRMDRDGNGKLSKDEVPDRMKERLAPMFEKAGKDELTKEEVMKFAFKGKSGAQGKIAQGGGKPPLTPEMFKKVDKDGDGKIKLSDVPEQGRKLVERMYDVLDKDHDEPLTEKEFAQAAQKMRERMEGRSGSLGKGGGTMNRPPFRPEGGVFAKLDTDEDGQLSKSELSKAAEKFDELDEDGDGQLSPRELLGPPPMPPQEAREGLPRKKKKKIED